VQGTLEEKHGTIDCGKECQSAVEQYQEMCVGYYERFGSKSQEVS